MTMTVTGSFLFLFYLSLDLKRLGKSAPRPPHPSFQAQTMFVVLIPSVEVGLFFIFSPFLLLIFRFSKFAAPKYEFANFRGLRKFGLRLCFDEWFKTSLQGFHSDVIF